MPHYRVLLRGQNFWLEIQGKPRRMGFFTNRFVEAPSAERAEHLAVDLLRQEGRLKPLNAAEDPPRVFFDEIEEIEADAVPAVVQGLTFFPDDREPDA